MIARAGRCNVPDEIAGEMQVLRFLDAGLLAQKGPDGAIGDLTAAAKADPKFLRRDSPEDFRKRLNELQADSDMHDIVVDAETDWMSS